MWIGWQPDELSKMLESVKEVIKGSKTRSSKLVTMMLWTKLRINLTDEQISMIMNYKSPQEDRRKRVSKACSSVQDALLTHFVSRFPSANHLTRAEALVHQTVYSKTFFGNNGALILDGTYYFIRKSQDHAFQRKTY